MKVYPLFPEGVRASAFVLVLSVLAFVLELRAEVYDFHYAPGAAECVGRIEYFDSSFDSLSSNLKFTVNFSPVRATCEDDSSGQLTLPDGYMLVINNGPFPSFDFGYHPGDVAIFYFDGSDPANPRLTVYSYIGNMHSSWQQGSLTIANTRPDKILSSLASPELLKQMSARNESNGSRTFEFRADISKVINHKPAYPTPGGVRWYGAGFDNLVGIWFAPVAGLRTNYGSDGFLTQWDTRDGGFYDMTDHPTIGGPVCMARVNDEVTTLSVGESIRAVVVGAHELYDRLVMTFPSIAPHTVSSDVSGTERRAPYGVELNWTASAEDIGKSYRFDIKFTDSQGRSASCGFGVRVPGADEPDCVVDRCGVCNGDGNSCLGCEETNYTATLVTLDTGAKKQERIIQRAAAKLKHLSGAPETVSYLKRVLKLAHELQIRNWTITWQHPQVMRECTNETLCVSHDHSEIIAEYRIHSEELRKLTHEVVARIVKAQYGVKTAKDKAFLKWADEQHRRNLGLADTVPAATWTCA